MNVRLRIQSAGLDDERIQESAIELRRLLSAESEATAVLPESVAAPGTKGDPVTLGTLALTFLTSGAAISVFKVLETYVSRKRSIEIEVSRPDGRKLVLKAQDLSDGQLAATQRMFEDFVK